MELYGVFDQEKGRVAIASTATPQQILERILICREFKSRLRRTIYNPRSNSQTLEAFTRFEHDAQEEIEDLFQYYIVAVRKNRTNCNYPKDG